MAIRRMWIIGLVAFMMLIVGTGNSGNVVAQFADQNTENEITLVGHFGETWTGGNATAGLIVDNRTGTAGGDGLRGISKSTLGYIAGVTGINTSSGTGVFGKSAGGGTGVYGYSSGLNAAGVLGKNASPNGGFGIKGISTSNNGIGVFGTGFGGVHGSSGYADGYGVKGNNDGSGIGVFGFSAGGTGVYGEGPTAISGLGNIGVLGQSYSGSYGVWGISTNGEGVHGAGIVGVNGEGTVGVHGYSDSGYGVEGISSNTGVYGTGSTGVKGESNDPAGYGVAGYNYSNGPGVYGTSNIWHGVSGYSVYASGVYGFSETDYGVYGRGPTGVRGRSSDPEGEGVSGWNEGTGYGVYGSSTYGTGLKGQSYTNGESGVEGNNSANTGYGVYGHGSTGVYGTGSTGVSGVGSDGVVGESTSTGGRGVYGISTNGSGVYGEGYDGVYGVSGSIDGYGVVGSNPIGFGLVAAGNDSTEGDNVGDILLSGNLGEIFSTGLLMDLYSNGDVWIELDQDNNSGNSCFTILRGNNSVLIEWCELGYLISTASQATVVETANEGQHLMYSVEGTGVWVEDVGTGTLVNGELTIPFDTVYAQAANLDNNYQVFVTARCDQPVLLYVSSQTGSDFTVKGANLDGSPSSCAFNYRVVAERLGYEGIRTEQYTQVERTDLEGDSADLTAPAADANP